MFESGFGQDTFAHLGEVRCPVTVVVGGEQGPSTFGPAVAEALPAGRLETHSDLTHFGPMQDPAQMAVSVRAAFGSPSLS